MTIRKTGNLVDFKNIFHSTTKKKIGPYRLSQVSHIKKSKIYEREICTDKCKKMCGSRANDRRSEYFFRVHDCVLMLYFYITICMILLSQKCQIILIFGVSKTFKMFFFLCIQVVSF